MKILVVSSSRHGSTEEIAYVICEELVKAGLEIEHMHPEDVVSLDGYDAVVVGSAVYMTAWIEEAVEFTKRFAKELDKLPVWAFSVGLAGVYDGVASDPLRVGPVLLALDPDDHVVFGGCFDPSKLTLRERSIARLGGASEGDFRDMDQVRAWASSIAATLIP